MSFANVGQRWSNKSLPEYLATLRRPSWAKSVTIHHCAAPNLAQRPSGFTAQHIENIAGYYKNSLGWSRGPHFFTDEDDIFGMTPPTLTGTHAVSFNSSSIGFEMLGNYDSEDPKSGRGLAVCKTTAIAAKSVLDWLGIPVSASTVKFHRDDPKTSKTCPGGKIDKAWFLSLMRNESVSPIVPATPLTVPLVDFVSKSTGKPYGTIAKLLVKDGKNYMFAGKWVEGAYYDATAKTTVAPQGEAMLAASRVK